MLRKAGSAILDKQLIAIVGNFDAEKSAVLNLISKYCQPQNAGQILTVDGGRIGEAGSHGVLLTEDGKYAAMWNAEQALSA